MGDAMKTTQRFAYSALIAVMLTGLGACSSMSSQDKSTAVGAVGGAVLTGGSTVGTIGGAGVGGIIGHEVGD